MDELTFEDYKRRISIQEVLEDAGYRFNRRDGMRWPSYSRVDSDGRRIFFQHHFGRSLRFTEVGLCQRYGLLPTP